MPTCIHNHIVFDIVLCTSFGMYVRCQSSYCFQAVDNHILQFAINCLYVAWQVVSRLLRMLESYSDLICSEMLHEQLSRPHTKNLYDGFVCHDAVVAVAVTSD